MEMKDFLQPENVFVDLSAGSKERALQQVADIASSKTGVSSAAILAALLEREALGSTGIGGGVALPHTVMDGIQQPLCLVFTLAKPIAFEAVDDVPVDILVLLLTPASAKGESLNLLSCTARRLREGDACEAIRRARRAEAVYALLAGEARD